MADDSAPHDNLISFTKVKERVDGGAPFVRKPVAYKPNECQHKAGFDVDAKEHEVECCACKKLVDPFKAILIVANEWDWTSSHQLEKRLKKEIKELTAERDRLKALLSKERTEAPIPGKLVRKALRGLADTFNKRAAGCKSVGNKPGEEAWGAASYTARTAAERLLEAVLKEEEGSRG